jgi:hypothetical protein
MKQPIRADTFTHIYQPTIGSQSSHNLGSRGASPAQWFQTYALLAFGKAFALFVKYERDMAKGGYGQSQGLIQQDLARRRLQQVGTPYNLVYTHQRIIHNHGKLIGKDAIRATDDEITHDSLYLLLNRTCQQIREGDDSLVIHTKSQ